MAQPEHESRFPIVGDGRPLANSKVFHTEELQLATRNRGMPLEGLRYSITPHGMHYLLIHFDIPEVDVETWRLSIGGLVSRPTSLSMAQIKELPSRTLLVTMECAGNGRALLSPRAISQPWLLEAIGTAEWTGTPLRYLLEKVGLSENVTEVLFTGLDQGYQGDLLQYYQRSLDIKEILASDILLAYEMNGEPLQPQHGFPLRLVVPGWYGFTNVKWLERIEAIEKPFQGYQQVKTYQYTQSAKDPGKPVTHIRVRALMIPPGIPDFVTRTRVVKSGIAILRGRAWAGGLDISRVEVSVDGGVNWQEAQLGDRPSPFAWREWSFAWYARPGRYSLSVRGTDSQGSRQPVNQEWNYQGMGNTMAQRVDVIVE